MYVCVHIQPENIDPSITREDCTDKRGVWSFGITLVSNSHIHHYSYSLYLVAIRISEV